MECVGHRNRGGKCILARSSFAGVSQQPCVVCYLVDVKTLSDPISCFCCVAGGCSLAHLVAASMCQPGSAACLQVVVHQQDHQKQGMPSATWQVGPEGCKQSSSCLYGVAGEAPASSKGAALGPPSGSPLQHRARDGYRQRQQHRW